jgi:hypothetical protein
MFELTDAQFASLIHGNCFYCGCPPASHQLVALKHELTYNGIDRKDNSQGYIEGNVVSCCSVCNNMKGTMSTEEFIAHLRKIVNRQFS